MKKYMTKKEAVKLFKEENSHIIEKYKNDRIALHVAFSTFTDMLCKNGDISQSQYDRWSNPYEKK